jgi:hypothetical protein
MLLIYGSFESMYTTEDSDIFLKHMSEYFLHFIWQYQFFSKKNLQTNSGDELLILHPGYRNPHQGPDFSHARLKINGLEWHGNVEIHYKASDWFLHQHQHDPNYDSIVLHVVWQNDCEISRFSGEKIPVLILADRTDTALVEKYRLFVNAPVPLPCRQHLEKIPPAYWTTMTDKVLIERLERKAYKVLALYENNQQDWDETFWQLLAGSFGFKINNEPFEQLSRSLPYKLLLRHVAQPLQIEALLFGQAGFLEEAGCYDLYVQKLKQEYTFLAHKYTLHEKKMHIAQWKFLRTRPFNFPTVRLAQLAALLTRDQKLINLVYEKQELNAYYKFFEVPLSSYWQKHYRFGEEIKTTIPSITPATVHSLLINVLIPFKAARYLSGIQEGFPDELFALLEKIPAEKNNIVRIWEQAGMRAQNAMDSQAQLELYNQYCLKRKCLYCTLGTLIMKS